MILSDISTNRSSIQHTRSIFIDWHQQKIRNTILYLQPTLIPINIYIYSKKKQQIITKKKNNPKSIKLMSLDDLDDEIKESIRLSSSAIENAKPEPQLDPDKVDGLPSEENIIYSSPDNNQINNQFQRDNSPYFNFSKKKKQEIVEEIKKIQSGSDNLDESSDIEPTEPHSQNKNVCVKSIIQSQVDQFEQEEKVENNQQNNCEYPTIGKCKLKQKINDNKQQKNQQPTFYQQLKDNDIIAQTMYMEKGKVQQKTKQKQPQKKKNQVVYKVKDQKYMYWQFGDKQLNINYQILFQLHQSFLKKKQTIIPIISEQQLKSNHIIIYMQSYTTFLNQFYQQDFFQSLQSLNQLKPSQSIASSFFKSNHSTTNKKNYYQYLSQYFTTSKYSKAQILLNYIALKSSTLSLIKKLLKQQKQSFIPQEIQQKLQCQIGYLQLLVSFENALNCCQQNLKQGGDNKMWKQHQKKINQLRQQWIKKVQQRNHDFVFQI